MKQVIWKNSEIHIESQNEIDHNNHYSVASTGIRLNGFHLKKLVIKDGPNELKDIEFDLTGGIFTDLKCTTKKMKRK